MMESTIGGVLFDVWFKEDGQQKGIVAGHTGRLEGVRSKFGNVRFGSKWTSGHFQSMSAVPPKADIAERGDHVRFVPKADIDRWH